MYFLLGCATYFAIGFLLAFISARREWKGPGPSVVLLLWPFVGFMMALYVSADCILYAERALNAWLLRIARRHPRR